MRIFVRYAYGADFCPLTAGIFVRLRRRESTDAAKPDGIVSGKGSSGKGAALRRLRSSASVGEPPFGVPVAASPFGIPLQHPVAAFRFGIPSRHSPFGASVQTLATQRTPAEKNVQDAMFRIAKQDALV